MLRKICSEQLERINSLRRKHTEKLAVDYHKLDMTKLIYNLPDTGIPRKIIEEIKNLGYKAIFDSHKTKIYKHFIKNWDDVISEGQSMLFFGTPGNGKTFFASYLAIKLLISQGNKNNFDISVRYKRFFDIVQSFKKTDHMPSELMNTYSAPSLLIIDEINRQSGFTTDINILHNIVDERICMNKPTIIISNGTLDHIKNNIVDTSVFDRIRASGPYPFVNFSGESRREYKL